MIPNKSNSKYLLPILENGHKFRETEVEIEMFHGSTKVVKLIEPA
jgi:hypothetical protein